ncbi:MAG: hypothetical protein A2269_00880 [Lentisphaerae bacterium RIFOXYA12_FULL_60_10]|nr:MAG: hypothetical protein A2269_00880 [Lentisphaerae bacterium RIFOXYA12_FULL_60_10]
MNKANISYTRNNLSKLLACVREGESVLIVDRERPIARLEPVDEGTGRSEGFPLREDLVRRGLICPARTRLDIKRLKAIPLPSTTGGGDILDSLLADREDAR